MKHRVVLPGVFPLEGGGTLRDVNVEVRTWGRFRREATLICHALTGNADADVWWKGIFGPGHLFDPGARFVVSMSVIGGCSGTTGPSSSGLGPEFPDITIRDMVHIQRATLQQINVTRLDLAIGGSMGGMQVLEWAVLYPEFVEVIVPIGVDSCQSPWAVALSETQRQAITNDPAFLDGHYSSDNQPVNGLSTARMIAMCSYRSPSSFDTRFGRESDGDTFAVQSYLRHQGQKLAERFDANSYLTLLKAMDSHDVGRARGPREAILNRIKHRALVIGVSSDILYPANDVRAMADSMPNADFALIDSANGHDAFLIETETLEQIIGRFLSDTRVMALPLRSRPMQMAQRASSAAP